MSKLTRRDFLSILKRILAATGLTALFAPVIAYFYPPDLEEIPSEPVRVAGEEELPLGASKTVPFGRYPALVIHTEKGLRAYSAVCTHFSCIVKWNGEEKVILCPCHDGYFEPDAGNVISGPPPSPLEKLDLMIKDGDIYIGGTT